MTWGTAYLQSMIARDLCHDMGHCLLTVYEWGGIFVVTWYRVETLIMTTIEKEKAID